MGLIRAAKDAISTMLADQWREYFYCDSLSDDVLVVKGQKKFTEGRNSNTKGVDNIISNGSIIAVNEGQCMIIVDQGGVVEVCAEAGQFVYEASTEPSLFYGGLGDGVKNTFNSIGKRFSFGGNAAKDQRVYFFNTKEIMSNLFGTPTPIPFRVIDANLGLDMDTTVRCSGEYSFKLTDPLLFYKNVCGNVEENYTRDKILSQMKAELINALQPALATVSSMGVRYSEITQHTVEITNALNEVLSNLWREKRGIEIVTINLNPPKLSAEIEKMITDLQQKAVYRNADMRAANLSEAQAEVFRNMGKQEGGVSSNDMMGNMMGMMAMNMMGNMMGGQPGAQPMGMPGMQQGMAPMQNGAPMQQAAPMQNAAPSAAAPILGWTCSCGKTDNRGKFCMECGTPKPSEAGWTCGCGTVNQGKFCMNCGTKKPEGAPLYKCDKCGWEPEDPANPPKFCPECGDIFDDNDKK